MDCRRERKSTRVKSKQGALNRAGKDELTG